MFSVLAVESKLKSSPARKWKKSTPGQLEGNFSLVWRTVHTWLKYRNLLGNLTRTNRSLERNWFMLYSPINSKWRIMRPSASIRIPYREAVWSVVRPPACDLTWCKLHPDTRFLLYTLCIRIMNAYLRYDNNFSFFLEHIFWANIQRWSLKHERPRLPCWGLARPITIAIVDAANRLHSSLRTYASLMSAKWTVVWYSRIHRPMRVNDVAPPISFTKSPWTARKEASAFLLYASSGRCYSNTMISYQWFNTSLSGVRPR